MRLARCTLRRFWSEPSVPQQHAPPPPPRAPRRAVPSPPCLGAGHWRSSCSAIAARWNLESMELRRRMAVATCWPCILAHRCGCRPACAVRACRAGEPPCHLPLSLPSQEVYRQNKGSVANMACAAELLAPRHRVHILLAAARECPRTDLSKLATTLLEACEVELPDSREDRVRRAALPPKELRTKRRQVLFVWPQRQRPLPQRIGPLKSVSIQISSLCVRYPGFPSCFFFWLLGSLRRWILPKSTL